MFRLFPRGQIRPHPKAHNMIQKSCTNYFISNSHWVKTCIAFPHFSKKLCAHKVHVSDPGPLLEAIKYLKVSISYCLNVIVTIN